MPVLKRKKSLFAIPVITAIIAILYVVCVRCFFEKYADAIITWTFLPVIVLAILTIFVTSRRAH